MGLDQYAYARKAGDAGGADEQEAQMPPPAFVWRKHAKLQAFMEALFETRTGKPSADLNCGELILTVADIETLESQICTNALPCSEGGFFYGHQHQDESAEHYRPQDLEFCAWAKGRASAGETVVFSCWW